MIKRIKLGFRMMRYAYGLKGALFGMGCFLLAGTLMRLVPSGNLMLPNLFLMLLAIWPAQMIYSLSVSDLIQVSPHKKEMQTSVPALVTAAIAVPMFLLSAVLELGDRNEPDAKSALVLGAAGACLLLIYAGAAYKFYLASTILFFISYGVIGNAQWWCLTDDGIRQFLSTIPYAAFVAFGLLLILLGTGAGYGLALLLYRYPLSKQAQAGKLRKQM